MKSSTSMFIWSLVWIPLGITGFIVGNDNIFIVGLVASTVNGVGSQLARLIEKQNGGTNK